MKYTNWLTEQFSKADRDIQEFPRFIREDAKLRTSEEIRNKVSESIKGSQTNIKQLEEA